MAEIENLIINISAETSELNRALKKVIGEAQEETKKVKENLEEGFSPHPLTKLFDPEKGLGPDKPLEETLVPKAFDPSQTLSEAEKEFLKGIEGLKSTLEAELKEALDALRKTLEEEGADEAEIEARIRFVEEFGKKRIDDLVDDFSDELEEAVKSLSKTLSDAFVEMALEGEFSAKKIGDAFLRTALDLVSKELIQKPLESLLGSLFGSVFGSASGGAIAQGVPTLINEQGQEIFIPHTPGRIVSAPDTRRMLEGGSPVVVNQNLNFDTAIKNDMAATIIQASPLIVEQTKRVVLESLRGRRT